MINPAESRAVNGALLINKPSGISSARVVSLVKRRFGLKKVGHAGTLDPLATGLLIILANKATRLQSLFFSSLKTYCGTFRLGIGTDTDDLEGKVIESDSVLAYRERAELSELAREIESEFRGELWQEPPLYSALKVQGEKSYDLARRGKAVELMPRKIEIQEVELNFVEQDKLSYRIKCSKGTYVRSLARDIGRFLGTCGCVESICRESVGSFELKEAMNLEGLEELEDISGALISIEDFLLRFSGIARVSLSDKACLELSRGVQYSLSDIDIVEPYQMAAIFDENERFNGLAHRDDFCGWRIQFWM